MEYDAKKGIGTMLQGRAAEYRVAAELAIRGHIPSFPSVDYGFDLALDNGIRIQVKSARLQKHRQFPEGVYRFSFRRDVVDASRKESRRRYLYSEPRDYSKVCDFFVLWGIDEDRFWVIPCEGKPRDLFIAAGDDVKRVPWLDLGKITAMRSSGMNNCQIARAFNVSHTTIRLAFKRGESKYNKRNGIRFAMICEGRWDLLDVNAAVEKTVSDSVQVQVP